MKLENAKTIFQKQSPDLINILENWDKHDTKEVLLAYGELKRMGARIPSNLEDKLGAFCRANNETDIDKYLERFVAANGFQSFEELYNKALSLPNTEKEYEQPKKYPGLRTLVGIYNFVASLTAIISFAIIIFSTNSMGDMGIIIALITFVLGSILVLGLRTIAESIKVLIDIEYNTRKAAERNRN